MGCLRGPVPDEHVPVRQLPRFEAFQEVLDVALVEMLSVWTVTADFSGASSAAGRAGISTGVI